MTATGEDAAAAGLAVLAHVRALYDFNAEDPEEVSFEAGEVLRVLARDDETEDGWWRGYNAAGELGFFPSNYVTATEPGAAKVNNNNDDTDAASAQEQGTTTATTTAPVVDILDSDNDDEDEEEEEEEDEGLHEHVTVDVVAAEEQEAAAQAVEVAAAAAAALALEQEEQRMEQQPEQREDAVVVVDPVVAAHAADHSTEPEKKPDRKDDEDNDDDDDEEPYIPPLEETPKAFMNRLSLLPKVFAPTTDPVSWSKSEVTQWLQATGFSELRSLFVENDINGEALLELDQETLKELNIRNIGRRIKLLLAIGRLKETNDDDAISEPVVAAEPAPAPVAPAAAVVVDVEEPAKPQPPAAQPPQVVVSRAPLQAQPPPPKAIGSNAATSGTIRASQRAIENSQEKSKRSRHHRPLTLAVPDITAKDIHRPDFTGWLWKQGGQVKTWKRRWFTLSGNCIYYFKAPEDAKALGMVLLPSYSILPAKEIKRPNAFKAFHAGARTYYFSADSEAEMNLWIKHMQRATVPVAASAAGAAAAGLSSLPSPIPPPPAVESNDKTPLIFASLFENVHPPAHPPPAELLAQSRSTSMDHVAVEEEQEQEQVVTINEEHVVKAEEVKVQAEAEEVKVQAEEVKVQAEEVKQEVMAPIQPIERPKPVVQPKTVEPSDPNNGQQGQQGQQAKPPKPPIVAPKPIGGIALNISAGGFALKKSSDANKDEEPQVIAYLNTHHRPAGASEEEHQPLTKETYVAALEDGLLLVGLAETLTKDTAGKIHRSPRLQMHKVDNIASAIRLFDKHGVSVPNVTADDIYKGDVRKIVQFVKAVERKWA